MPLRSKTQVPLPSHGGLSLDPPPHAQVGRKSYLSKAKEQAATKIRKGTQVNITRALRARKSLPPKEK
jgi:hypothetical protein